MKQGEALYRFLAEGMEIGKIPEFTGCGLIRSRGGGPKWYPPREEARGKTPTNASWGAEILSTPFSGSRRENKEAAKAPTDGQDPTQDY
jgi:hypothetical protein